MHTVLVTHTDGVTAKLVDFFSSMPRRTQPTRSRWPCGQPGGRLLLLLLRERRGIANLPPGRAATLGEACFS